MTNEEKIAKFKAQRSDKFSLVLNDNELNLLKSARFIKEQLESNIWTIEFLACIKHDRDIDEETKFVKTTHYHLVIVFDGTYRVGTIMKWLCDIFKINENQIEIQKCNSVPMQCRYLAHVDDPDKEQYNPEEIVSNDLVVLKRYFSLRFIRDLAMCVNEVRRLHYDLETIMLEIANYDKYRKYINDLIINHTRSR